MTVDTSSITATDDASVTIDGEQQGDKDEENSSKKGHVHRRKRQRGDFLGHTLTIGKGVIRQEHKVGGSALFARSGSQDQQTGKDGKCTYRTNIASPSCRYHRNKVKQIRLQH